MPSTSPVTADFFAGRGQARRCAHLDSDRGQRLEPTRFRRPRRNRRDATAAFPLIRQEPAHRLALEGAPRTAPSARSIGQRRETVDDDGVDRKARTPKVLERIGAFRDGHRFGQRDPTERGPLRIAQQFHERTPLAVEIGNQRIRFVGCPLSSQSGGELAVLALHVVEDGGERAEQLRHGEHAQGVAGGRGVDDDRIVAIGAAETADFEERCHLVDPWQRQAHQARHVVAVEPRAAEQQRFQQRPASGQPPPEGARCLHFERMEPAGPPHGARTRRQWLPERVAG